jgi:capsular polysaccharide biosynthesis protein
MRATNNNSVATQNTRHFTLPDLTTPLLRRKRTLSITFLSVVSLTLWLSHTIPQLSAHTSTITILAAILVGLLIGVSLTYLVDYRDPCFHSPAQVIRTLRIPLVVTIPKRTP